MILALVGAALASVAAMNQQAGPLTAPCAPIPRLDIGPRFADPRGVFAPTSAALRATASNFQAAYRRACANGLLHGTRLFGAIETRDRVMLVNAPDSNQAGFYADETGSAFARRLWLEYHFVGHDGEASVPSADDLHEAIYCHVRGATPQEQEEEGRCLPD